MIPTILSKLFGNVTDAADLMNKAAMHRDTCRDLATWCQEMATSHLGFLCIVQYRYTIIALCTSVKHNFHIKKKFSKCIDKFPF